ncbi:hypothetical protein BD408DRAFT_485133 [Parasitella parasitica]|nr:hypothetical protein BD408DRAFT_485133 [Parasitella parasitica]
MTPTSSKRDGEIPAVICFVTGIAAVLMGYSVYSHLKTLHDRSSAPRKAATNKPGSKLEDSIRLKSLAYLTQSHNVNIQSSSIKIILERAMSATYLPKIIAACDKGQPIEIKSKALPSLQLLTRKENNKTTLLEAGALNVLVDALKCQDPAMKEVTQRYVAVAICDLIQGSDANKYCILELGVLDPIKRILTSDDIRNNELKYWTLMILYQISLSDPLPKVLIQKGFVRLLARMARMTYGNTNMPKFCMQSLVRIAANVDVSEAKKVLKELLDYNIVDLISNCLRGDDVELIYWAAGLMHEFVLKDVAADKFRKIKGIHAILASLLSAEEMYISRVILRTIKFMAFGQEKFRREMVRSGMVKKIMHCLSLDDDDVRYWAILCIHVVAGQVESHQDIISAAEFEILLDLALSSKIKVAIFVSDILSLICCISSNSTHMEPNIALIVKTLNVLLVEGEIDVQYNAAGAIFNVMTMTHAFANKVRDTCFDALLSISRTASHERVQLTCTKGALMVAIKNRFLVPNVNIQIAEPLVEKVNSISQLSLPVMITQALLRATKQESGAAASLSTKTSSTAKSGFSIHDAMQHDDDEEERDLEEMMEEEEDEYPQTPEYIDVSEQGTISNASRLDRVLLKDKRKHKLSNKSSPTLTSADISYLFDTNIPSTQREILLMNFELPLDTTDTLAGALTALNILLENEQIMRNMVFGAGFNHANGAMMEHFMMDIDDEYYTMAKSNTKTSAASSSESSSGFPAFPENICRLLQNLVQLSAYPALDEWASLHHREYPLSTINEAKAITMLNNVIEWICSCAELPNTFDHQGESSDQDMSSCSNDSDYGTDKKRSVFVTVHKQQSYKKRQTYHRRHRRRRHNRYNRYNRQTLFFHSDDDVDDDGNDDESSRSTISYEDSEDDNDRRMLPAASNATASTATVYPRRRKVESAAERMGETRRKGFANRALVLLNSLTKHASIKQYLVHQAHFIPILVYLYEEYNSLSDRVMACLGGLFSTCNRENTIDIPESAFRLLAILLWRDRRSPLVRKQSWLFYSRLVLAYCSRSISQNLSSNNASSTAFVEIDLSSKSKYCLVNQLQVRNDSWTFETIRATHYVPARLEDTDTSNNKYAFEVVLESSGLMQVGWVTDHFEFDAEGGQGVGDDAFSYGYDGNRSKKWHGRYTSMRTSYGLKWAEGDVITCAIDMDNAEIRYYKNGKDMGVAFCGILVSRNWYPAMSLATGQQCRFQFGGTVDPLKYLPDGYTSLASLAQNTPAGIELPPPQVTTAQSPSLVISPTTAEEPEIIDLSKALAQMSVDSTVNLSMSHQKNSKFNASPSASVDVGNTEPDLKPIDSTVARENHALKTNVSISNTRQYQASLIVEKIDVYHKPLPSLYFETTATFYHRQHIPNESIIAFGLQSLNPESSFHFEYNRRNESCCLIFGKRFRSKSFQLPIKEGDIIGILYIDESNEVGLTINGNISVFVYLDDKSTPYLPFTSGFVKSDINYGERSYTWKYAETLACRNRMSKYFDKLLRN